MRLEATIPESRGQALNQLAQELGTTRSQLVDEAVGLFLKVVLEARQGRRVATINPTTNQPVCELTTPTLSTLDWHSQPQALTLPTQAHEHLARLLQAPPKAPAKLRAAAQRHLAPDPDAP